MCVTMLHQHSSFELERLTPLEDLEIASASRPDTPDASPGHFADEGRASMDIGALSPYFYLDLFV